MNNESIQLSAATVRKTMLGCLHTRQKLQDSFFFYCQSHNLNLCREAFIYLQFGVARRLNWIFKDLCWLTTYTPPDRTKPLTPDECGDAGRYLNSMYLHIRGVLDNFAWALLWQLNPVKAQELEDTGGHRKVELFRDTGKNSLPTKLQQTVEGLKVWNDDLKSRRDPVAHRLPLQIPPQFVTRAEADKYLELEGKDHENLNNLATAFAEHDVQNPYDGFNDPPEQIMEHLDQIDKLSDEYDRKREILSKQMQSVGRFVPKFLYSLDESDLIDMYPTILEDCNNLITIADEVKLFLISLKQDSQNVSAQDFSN